jgi:hypothetical protein
VGGRDRAGGAHPPTGLTATALISIAEGAIAGLRVGTVVGANPAASGAILAAANSQTAVISGGTLYILYARPLLPDEVPDQG